jgi:hypothetical protein
MVFVYIVRCNFSASDKEQACKEQAWNDWYSGPKIAQMLRKPHFRSCQRFRRSLGHGRNYLALWTLASPDAFKTQEYTSDWGFFEWQHHVIDWSRDLFDSDAANEQAFAVGADGALDVISFDGMSADAAQSARARMTASQPDMMWLPVIGLDRHTPLIGLRPRSDADAPVEWADSTNARMQQASYRPISAFQTAGANVA